MPANTPRGISYPLYSDPLSSLQSSFQDMATDMDGLVQQLDDRLTAAGQRPSAKVSGVTNQAWAPTTDVTVTWEAEDFDNAGMVDLGVSATRIQLLEQGVYIVGATVTATNQIGTYGVQATFAFNSPGAGGGLVNQRGVSANLDTSPDVNMVNPVGFIYTTGAAPVNVTLVVRQNGGGALQIQSRNFWAAKISNVVGAY